MAEIKVNEDGQAFFDFEALEKKTSKDFVGFIQKHISGYSKLPKSYKTVVNYGKLASRVYVYSFLGLEIFSFNHENGEYKTSFLSENSLEIIKELIQGDLDG